MHDYNKDLENNISLQNLNERRFMSSSRDSDTIWQSLMDRDSNGNQFLMFIKTEWHCEDCYLFMTDNPIVS